MKYMIIIIIVITCRLPLFGHYACKYLREFYEHILTFFVRSLFWYYQGNDQLLPCCVKVNEMLYTRANRPKIKQSNIFLQAYRSHNPLSIILLLL